MTLVLTEAVAPGGGDYMAPLHTHDRDDEAFYVLEGTLAFRIGDERASKCRPASARRARRHRPHVLESNVRAGSYCSS